MNIRCRWPPVLAGVLIGSSIIMAFVIAGRGIGASGAMTRLAATVQNALFPDLTWQSVYFSRYFADGRNPLDNYLSYLMIGLILGAFVGALLCRDLKLVVERGPRSSVAMRLVYALIGGIIVGFAARLARGCTSGQGLVGAAQLSAGAWVFLLAIFAGGFATAYLVRKQWI
ncbi:MAG TPA: hypothetical protein ENK50_03105 [Sedimenticola sp.]|nr:hypothetical protein [Sedimenticola sp.]